MLARLDPINSSMFGDNGIVMWPPPVTKETPEEKQPGGWASQDITWNARMRAVKAVKQARTSIEEGVSDDHETDYWIMSRWRESIQILLIS